MSRLTKLRERYNRATGKHRYWYSIMGEKPGWGYASGWVFGPTPEQAKKNALRDAARWAKGKWQFPVKVHLQLIPAGEKHGSKYYTFDASK